MKATLENEITITKEQRFQEIISQIEVHQPKFDFEKYPNFIFWFDNSGKYFCSYDKKTGYFWFSYSNFWSDFESEFNLNPKEMRAFLISQLEKNFKFIEVTSLVLWLQNHLKLEEYIKLMDIKTNAMFDHGYGEVEEYFKSKK